MSRALRLLPAALLLAGSGAVLGATPSALGAAPRCPAGPSTVQAQTMAADDVFTGTVTERASDGTSVGYTVEVDRVYKGDVDATQVTVTTATAARGCGLPDLKVDSPYLFFTTGQDLVTSSESGTAAATDARVAQVEALLGDGRAPTPPEPETATFTVVGGEPTTLARSVAPGLALVIVGVLGLGLATGLGRRGP